MEPGALGRRSRERRVSQAVGRSGEPGPFQSPYSIIMGKKMPPFPFDNALLLFLNEDDFNQKG
jgi:hypothetical protein